MSYLPLMGSSAYEGYVVWKSGEATKYYAFDLDTTYKAVMCASDQLKLETTLIKSDPKKGYSLDTKNPGMGTGLSHSKGELMMEESASVCL